VITVVIPAHNEGRVIGRLLSQLVSTAKIGELDVIVVANGCSDDTTQVAASFRPHVRVLSLPVASKREALAAGDRAALGFPRVYADADIELRTEDVRALAAALRQPAVLAAAPRRELVLDGRPWPVRWYYSIWAELPEVQRGLFGRGAIAVDARGHERIASAPPLLADDLAASLAFGPDERRIVSDARVVVHTPRTVADLLRRRIRAVEGVAQISKVGWVPGSGARTRPSDLVAIVRRRPRGAPRAAFFLAVAVLARVGARYAVARGGYSTWLRDESSRATMP
jgi:glycosyltransferase involved in cell wall biosynthesis